MRRCRPLLGTFVEIEAEAELAIEAGFAAIERIHRLMSAHEPASELSRLNRGERLRISPETAAVLDRARFWAEASDGLFDPVLAGAAAIARGALPRHPDQPLPAADADWRAICRDGDTSYLERPATLDLGGIAKGHAVDRALAAMRGAGAGWALVNAGGDLAAFGRPQSVTIVEPRTRQPCVEVTVDGRALATSAARPDADGLDVAHLPRAGGDIVSVTVEARAAIDADALTKIAWAGHPRLGDLLALADARAFAICSDRSVVSLGEAVPA